MTGIGYRERHGETERHTPAHTQTERLLAPECTTQQMSPTSLERQTSARGPVTPSQQVAVSTAHFRQRESVWVHRATFHWAAAGVREDTESQSEKTPTQSQSKKQREGAR